MRSAAAAADPMPLDELSVPMAAALSVAKRLVTTYTGAAFHVRRDSDDDETDIGFLPTGLLDLASLIDFCTGANGQVVTVYDESGNARDFTQATPSRQPKIYDSVTGVLVQGTSNTPAMLFDSAASQFLARGDACGFSGNPDINVVFNWKRTAASTAADSVVCCLGTGAGAIYGQIHFPGQTFGNSILTGVRSFTPNPNPSTWGNYISSKASGVGIGSSTLEQNGVALAQTAVLNAANTTNIVVSSDATWGAFPNASFPAGGSGSTLIWLPSVLAGANLTLMRAVMAAMN